MAERFSENFWGGFDRLIEFVCDDASETADAFVALAMDRAKIESNYSKGLMRLSNGKLGGKELGSLRNALFAVKSDLENTAKAHELLGDEFKLVITKSLAAFRDVQEVAKSLLISGATTAGEYVGLARARLDQAQQRYMALNAQADLAEEKWDAATHNRRAKESEVKKWANKASAANKAVISAEAEYLEAVRSLNEEQERFQAVLIGIFDELQRLEEERRDHLKVMVQSYVAAVSRLPELYKDGSKILSLVTGAIDVELDMKVFTHNSRTSSIPSRPAAFVQYKRRNEALPALNGPNMTPPVGAGRGAPGGSNQNGKGKGKMNAPAAPAAPGGSRRNAPAGAPGGSRRKAPDAATAPSGGGMLSSLQKRWSKKTVSAKAEYPYEARETNEISFPAGAIIFVEDQDSSGWWKGTYQNQTGLFPSNYVQLL